MATKRIETAPADVAEVTASAVKECWGGGGSAY